MQAIPFWIASCNYGFGIAVLYTKLFIGAEKPVCLLYSPVIIYGCLFILMPVFVLLRPGGWFNVLHPMRGVVVFRQVMAAIQISSPKTNYLVDKLLSLRVIVVKVASSLSYGSWRCCCGYRERPDNSN